MISKRACRFGLLCGRGREDFFSYFEFQRFIRRLQTLEKMNLYNEIEQFIEEEKKVARLKLLWLKKCLNT